MNRRLFLRSLCALPLGGAIGVLRASAPATLPQFADITAKSGIRFRNASSPTSRKYLIESMTGGVAMFDYNGDGLLDLFFVNGAALEDPMPRDQQPDKQDPRFWNRLYRNNGDGTFTDVTEAAGVKGHSYGMGAAVGDFDNDGHPDLYVTNYESNILYRNNGDGTFTDITEKAGVAAGGWSAGACFMDFDNDGHLDLIVSRYVEWDFSMDIWCGARKPGHRAYCHPDHFKPVEHIVYRNNGNGAFTDVTAGSGFGKQLGKGLGLAFHDFDHDGRMDIVIANDSFPQQLFRNLGGGKFEETALLLGAAYDADGKTFAGMGIDFADYDNDGWPDLFINALAHQKYALFRNVEGSFDYVTGPTGLGGISMLSSGWGAKFIDYDNDGWKDLFVAQGHVMDNIELTQPAVKYREPPLLARNEGGSFRDVGARSGPPFQMAMAARGAAFGDLDNDGFLDVAINCNDEPAVVLRNQGGNGNYWLLIDTVGTRSNRDGIGAVIRVVTPDDAPQYGLVSTAGSYLSASDKRAHFGLGKWEKAKLIEIRWPSGVVQNLTDVPANQILRVTEPE
jgi:enediyne biosynthesis protein E4